MSPQQCIRRVGPLETQQQGVAVVTALLLTTLAITIVASLFWQQQVQVRSIENQRLQLQKQWVLRGALDWARLILREDGRNSEIDDLSEPWAIPLAPTRLDRYVESANISAEAGSAVLSGVIEDAQGRFNLTNLATQGNINRSEVDAFARLLKLLRQDPALAMAVAQHVALIGKTTITPQPDLARPLGLVQVDDLLALPGFDPGIISALRPHTIVLPTTSPLNVNTAGPELLAAKVTGLSLTDAISMTTHRQQSPFLAVANFIQRLPSAASGVDSNSLSVTSSFFLANGSVSIRNVKLEVQALIERQPTATRLLWVRAL